MTKYTIFFIFNKGQKAKKIIFPYLVHKIRVKTIFVRTTQGGRKTFLF